jgi:putative peptide zinc metalloprotease protein
MNLTRALEVALPEIPARTVAQHYPRLDPGTTFREHIEDGKPMVRIYIPSVGGMYTLPPKYWQLAQLFDGKRSYEEIATLYSQQAGAQYAANEVRDFAGEMESGDFWYKTAQEKNILYLQQSIEERRKKLQSRRKWADLSEITFPAFNPDRFLTWVYRLTRFIYTPWFTILTLIGFAIGAGITISHWSEIGRDTVEFYNFSNKTWADVFGLYVVGMFVVAVHEFAHAHACKHYGGRVPAMGFALVYLTPAFYTDTTEGAVKGSRYQRLIISLAGIWSELMLCSIATPIWWGTPPDTLIHNLAYFIMMLTGLMSLVMNWNPLMKLDGYTMLCEIVGISDLKEDSTAYVSAWTKKNIWRLPVEVPYVPKRRRLGFAVYALTSGIYSYTVLYFVASFAGNFVRNFSPEWGFIPELVVAAMIFRSRIRLLVNFMKFLYLDKKDRVVAWFTPARSLAAVAAVIIFMALPLWHDSVSGSFKLEPVRSAVVNAHIPGVVTQVNYREGAQVQAGSVLATLRNLPIQSEFEQTLARYSMVSERTNSAAMRYTGYGTAMKEREQVAEQLHQISEMQSALQLFSPIAGTVLTPHTQDLVGSYLKQGGELLQVADLSALRARIYISEYDLEKVKAGSKARLQVQGMARKWNAETVQIAARPSEMDPQLGSANALKGLDSAHFYIVDLAVNNADLRLKPGMMGVARVYGRRRSLAGLLGEGTSNFWGRKLW